jgi:Flp pilus assembly pilin Flp
MEERDRMNGLRRLWTDESGQDLAEYALLLVLLTIVVIAALRVMGPTIASFFNEVSTNLSNVG